MATFIDPLSPLYLENKKRIERMTANKPNF
jgi:hypothetical protein